MIPASQSQTTCIGLEYFVNEDDELWSADDEDLVELAIEETARLGLTRREDVLDGCVIRMPKAYPVYDKTYKEALATIRDYLSTFGNLQLIGRNGQHRYNNQDHSMMTAILAAENILGAEHDVWSVNVEEEYHELSSESDEKQLTYKDRGGDRLVPQRIDVDPVLEAIERAYARYDPVALGSALGLVLGTGIFLATAFLLISGGANVGQHLSLLGNYLLGFEVTWAGALIGLIEGCLGGYLFGYLLALAINATIAVHETSLVAKLAAMALMDTFEQEQK